MMMNFPQYKRYKDSRVKWLGEIPEHWDLKKMKFIARQISDKIEMKNHSGYYLGLENIESWTGNLVETELIVEGIANKFQQGDILFGKLRPYLAKVYLAKESGCCTTEALVLRTTSLEQRFFSYLLLSQKFIELVNSSVYGSKMPRASWEFISDQFLPLPTLEEQIRIANFLDRKTAEIDQAIAQKQRLIELLKEQKAILIDRAVSNGLQRNAQMRDSGFEWLGEIPEQWEVFRAKYLFKEIDERSQTGGEELLSVSHITGVTPRSEKNVNMFMAEDYSGSKLCRKDDLVINIMWAWMGALGISNQTGIVSSSYGVFRQIKSNTFNSWYLEHLLRSKKYIAQYNRISTGLHSSRLRLYAHMFLNMEILLPPKEEQDEIEFLTTQQISEIDTAINAINHEIELIGELRSILIAQAVTGKIKL